MANDTTMLVATVKNEGPHILEWVAHHRLCGFDRIQIYQNDSTDTTVQTLRQLDRIGVIEYHENRHAKGAHQVRAYKRASRSQAYRDSDWCMALDGDEFLAIKTGEGTVRDLIRACPDGVDKIMVNWRVFGSAGQSDFSGDLVTERFTRAEPADEIRGSQMSGYKTLFRTDTWQRPAIHLPRDPKRPDRSACNGSGLLENEFARKNWRGLDPGGRKLAQVNHYILRDMSSFLLKRARGSANAPHREIGEKYWQRHDRNEEEDLTLAARSAAVRAEMERLDALADGKLLRLRQRALRLWRLALDELMEREDIRALRKAITEARVQPDQPLFASVRRGEPGCGGIGSVLEGDLIACKHLVDPVRNAHARSDPRILSVLGAPDAVEVCDDLVQTLERDHDDAVPVGDDHVARLDLLPADLDRKADRAGTRHVGRGGRNSGAPDWQSDRHRSPVVAEWPVGDKTRRAEVLHHASQPVAPGGASRMAREGRHDDIARTNELEGREDGENIRRSAICGKGGACRCAVQIDATANRLDGTGKRAAAKHGIDGEPCWHTLKGGDLSLGRSS